MVAIPAHSHTFTVPSATAQNIRDGSGGNVAVEPAELRTVLNEDLATKQPLDASLTAYAALTTAADKGIYFTGADTPATFDLTAFARTILDDANAAAVRTTIGSVIGTNVQAWSPNLDELAASAARGRDYLDAPVYVANRTALKALDTTKDTVAILTESGRRGVFVWTSGNYSTQIAADTREGIYIKADAIASSSGAWIRDFQGGARPEWYGATLVAESGAALQAWLDSDWPQLFLPTGVWRSDTDLTRDTDVHIYGSGVLDFSNTTDAQLHIAGSATVVADLNTNITKHTRSLTWATIPGSVVAGAIVMLWNSTEYSYGGRRNTYYDGAMFKVHSVSGNTAKTYEQAVDAYTVANFDVYVMSPVRVRLEGISAKPCTNTEVAPIKIEYGADVVIRDVKSLQGGIYGGVQVLKCYNVVYDCTTTENTSPHVDNEYGIIISSSQHVTVKGSASFATRHPVTIGSDGSTASVPNRFVNIIGMSLWNAPSSFAVAGDIHGHADHVTYSNCFMAGFSPGGRNVRCIGCTILGMPETTSQMCVTTSEMIGGYLEFQDCEFLSQGDGVTGTHAYILVQPIGPSGFGESASTTMREKLYIRVLNCRFDTPNAGANAVMLFVNADNADKNIQVVVDGIEWNAPDGLAFVRCRDNTLAAFPSDYIIVDNVYGPDGAALIQPESDVAAVPTREMMQGGSVSVECTSGASIATAAAQTYRYPYSRRPNIKHVTPSSVGADKSQWGGRTLAAHMFDLEATSCRPSVRTSAETNFSSTENVTISWSVENREI